MKKLTENMGRELLLLVETGNIYVYGNRELRTYAALERHGFAERDHVGSIGGRHYTKFIPTEKGRNHILQQHPTVAPVLELRAAIAVNVSADAAPAWTPAVGMLVRFKQGIQLSGDNRDVDAIQGMGVVGKVIRRCAEVGYEWTVGFGLDGDYNAATDELEPASTPAPDAAPERAAKYANLRMPEREYEPRIAPAVNADGATAEAVTGTWSDAWTAAERIYDLERELAAAQAEAAALRRFYNMARNLDLTSDMYRIASEQGGDVFIEVNAILYELTLAGVPTDDPAVYDAGRA